MSYSGQCNASFGMGGRSARSRAVRQQCRLPYELIVDDEVRDLQDRKYLLSPSDLAALDLVPELIAAGVNSLKIEGRMKSPEYVASATRQYRHAIDEGAGRPPRHSAARASCWNWKAPSRAGSRKAGSPGGICKSSMAATRPIAVSCVGKVAAIHGDHVAVDWSRPLRRGDGVVFPSLLGEDHDQGGRVYEILRKQSVKETDGGQVELAFGRERSISIACGRARNSGRPTIRKSTAACDRRLPMARAKRRVPLDLTVEAAVGSKLRVIARAGNRRKCCVESEGALDEAQRHPLTAEVLREQFGRLARASTNCATGRTRSTAAQWRR